MRALIITFASVGLLLILVLARPSSGMPRDVPACALVHQALADYGCIQPGTKRKDVVAFSTYASPADDLTRKLSETVVTYSVDGTDAERVLIELASEYQIPMGIEWVRVRAPKRIERTWVRTSLAQVLADIVRECGDYRYEVEEASVHVFYNGAQSDATNVLNLNVPSFKADNEGVSVLLLRTRTTAMRAVTPPPPGPRSEIIHTLVGARTSLDLKNVSLRAVLSRLVLASDRPIWVITFSAEAGLTPTGFRRTISLWNNTHFPDDQQPVWDFFKWGQKPPEPSSGFP